MHRGPFRRSYFLSPPRTQCASSLCDHQIAGAHCFIWLPSCRSRRSSVLCTWTAVRPLRLLLGAKGDTRSCRAPAAAPRRRRGQLFCAATTLPLPWDAQGRPLGVPAGFTSRQGRGSLTATSACARSLSRGVRGERERPPGRYSACNRGGVIFSPSRFFPTCEQQKTSQSRLLYLLTV